VPDGDDSFRGDGLGDIRDRHQETPGGGRELSLGRISG